MNIHEHHHIIGNVLQILQAHDITPIGTSTGYTSTGRPEVQIIGIGAALKIGAQWTVAGSHEGSYHLTHPLGGADVHIVLDLPGDTPYRKGDIVDLSAIGGAA